MRPVTLTHPNHLDPSLSRARLDSKVTEVLLDRLAASHLAILYLRILRPAIPPLGRWEKEEAGDIPPLSFGKPGKASIDRDSADGTHTVSALHRLLPLSSYPHNFKQRVGDSWNVGTGD